MCHGGGGGGDDQDTPRSVGRKEAGSRFPIPCTNQRPESDKQRSRRRRYTFGGFMSVDVSASPLYHQDVKRRFVDGLGLAGDHRVIIASSSAQVDVVVFCIIVSRMSRNGSVSWPRVICYSQCYR